MTNEIKKTIRKIQATLISIDNQTPVFFNIAQYQKMGLTVDMCRYVRVGPPGYACGPLVD